MKCTNLSLKRIGVTMTMINCLFTGAAEICKANNFFILYLMIIQVYEMMFVVCQRNLQWFPKILVKSW